MKAIPYLFLLLLLTTPAVASAQELVWAADAEGGAPYSFRDPRNPSRIIGFEVDLADALAKRMGRTARFVQNQWDGLVPGLERAQYDVVINGLEVTPERAEKIHFSNPYFYSTLTITTRADDFRVHRPDDLRGLTVGVLRVTFAERYVQSLGDVAIRSYDGQVQQFIDLALGRLDAVVMDTPVALYYATGPQLRNIEIPAARMAFGIGIRKMDEELLHQINAAIEAMKRGYADRAAYLGDPRHPAGRPPRLSGQHRGVLPAGGSRRPRRRTRGVHPPVLACRPPAAGPAASRRSGDLGNLSSSNGDSHRSGSYDGGRARICAAGYRVAHSRLYRSGPRDSAPDSTLHHFLRPAIDWYSIFTAVGGCYRPRCELCRLRS